MNQSNKLPDFFLLPVVKQLMIVVIFLLEILLICAPIMAESYSLTERLRAPWFLTAGFIHIL